MFGLCNCKDVKSMLYYFKPVTFVTCNQNALFCSLNLLLQNLNFCGTVKSLKKINPCCRRGKLMVCLSYSRDHHCCLPAVGMAFMGYTTRFCESFT